MPRYLQAAVAVIVSVVLLSGCGHHKKPVGPDVRGLNLLDAENTLKQANVAYTTHAKDATFGILVDSNFVVCSEAYVNAHEVRLEVAKHGC